MNKYRSAALVLAACAVGVSAAACSSGSSSTSSSAATSPAATSQAVSSSPPPTTGPAIAGRTLTVKGSLGSFPVPASAKVAENMAGGQSVVLVFGSVVPADVSRFYATELPKAGYSVTTNSMLSKGGDNGAYIVFSGHGFKGTIDSLDQFPGMSVAGIGDKNVTTIIFAPTT
jgi:ABC-type Fe3+-hydroxamate transport system substrate-binding protein